MATVTIQQALDLALQHHQAGRLADAEAVYRQILDHQPDHADAMHFLGIAEHQMGRNDVAMEWIRKAIQHNPRNSAYHSNLGEVCRAVGELDQAVEAYRSAIQINPGHVEAHNNLGNVLNDLGQCDQAIAACRAAIELNPGFAIAHYNLGNALRDHGKPTEAITAYRRASQLQPDNPQIYNNLGNVLREQSFLDQAIASYRAAIELQPGFAVAHSNLGNALKANGQLELAIATYHKAIQLQPDFSEAHGNLGSAFLDQGLVDQAIDSMRTAIRLDPDHAEGHSSLVQSLNYHPDYDATAVAGEARRWNEQHAKSLGHLIQQHTNNRDPERRLRIGYVSPDFREHSVARFMEPLLAAHDHERFEIFAYAQVPLTDSITERLRSHTDHWCSTISLSDEQLAERIRQDGIDILVDLAGHTANNRLLVFARKPAPVQVSYLGFPATTGLETIDYRLTDNFADPAESPENDHSEQLFRLSPTAWCFQASPDSPPCTRQPGPVTFGCFNNFAKVTERMLRQWGRILNAVPDSRMFLKAAGLGSEIVRERIRKVMGEEGIDPARLEFSGYTATHAEHLALYQQVDIALDTFPYHGTTTTCEALWMGVPVVSLAGMSHVSRVGLSLLENVGLPELVARSEDEYVKAAVDLANDPNRLTELRSTLRQRMESSPLMDAPRFTRNIETAYREIWRRWCVEVSEADSKP